MIWDSGPADTTTANGWDGGMPPTSAGSTNGFHNDDFAIDAENVSKHDRGCFNCGQEGHIKSECPGPHKAIGACHSCGEEGHIKADCPNRPPPQCKACRQPGHMAIECTNPMAVYDANVPLLPPDEAWSLLTHADKSKESATFKFALDCYTRAMPELDFPQVEEALRGAGFNFHLIAKEQEIADTKTIVNLQGEKDQTYMISFQFGYKPTRPKYKDSWPTSPEDNMERLAKAGYVLERGVPKCNNCDALGHIGKACPEEPREREKIEITCNNCNETGHYRRDCPKPREVRGGGCRNCNQPGHKAADCTEPRNMDNVECRSCGQNGHFSKDCPDREPMLCRNCNQEGHKAADCTEERKVTCRKCDEEGHMARDCPSAPTMTCYNCGQEGHGKSECPNERVFKCRNCDEEGHSSRECTKPRDYSRIQCRNCGEYGHTKVRCTADPIDEVTGSSAANGYEAPAAANAAGGADDWTNGAAAGGDWTSAPETTTSYANGGGW